MTDTIEIVVMIGVLGNFIVQIYDIIWCRHHDCGSKND